MILWGNNGKISFLKSCHYCLFLRGGVLLKSKGRDYITVMDLMTLMNEEGEF